MNQTTHHAQRKAACLVKVTCCVSDGKHDIDKQRAKSIILTSVAQSNINFDNYDATRTPVTLTTTNLEVIAQRQ